MHSQLVFQRSRTPTSVHKGLRTLKTALSGSPVQFLTTLIDAGLGLRQEARKANDIRGAWEDLTDYAQELVLAVTEPYAAGKFPAPADLEVKTRELARTLNEIYETPRRARNHGRIKSLLTVDDEGDIIVELRAKLTRALDMFGLRGAIDHQLTLHRVEEDLEFVNVKLSQQTDFLQEAARAQNELLRLQRDADNDNLLREFLPRAPASWDPSLGCLTGTRTDFLAEIMAWATSPIDDTSSNVLWISGMAGRGKTTISHSLAQQLNEGDLLISSFFCSRNDINLSSPNLLISTLAYDLGNRHSGLRPHIIRELRRDKNIGTAPFARQLSSLIQQPFEALRPEEKTSAKLVLWDALDECSADALESGTRSTILRTIGLVLPTLSPTLRFIITSRPNPDIRAAMQAARATELSMDDLIGVERDIATYVRHELEDIAAEDGLDGFCTTNRVNALVQRADNLFIWVSTALRYVASFSDPEEALDELLNSRATGAEEALDNLYMAAIQAPEKKKKDFAKNFQYLVGAIMVLQRPMGIPALTHLLHHPKQSNVPGTVVKSLGAIFTTEGEIRTLHASFFDFVTDPLRCTPSGYLIETTGHHQRLAKRCLLTMKGLLKRNICEIEDPSLLNSEVRDLPERLKTHIPDALLYACSYWNTHAKMLRIPDLLELLETFYQDLLLMWLEVMSLTSQLASAWQVLYGLRDFAEQEPAFLQHLFLAEAVPDALRFLERFTEVIRLNPAHIYQSALAFTPKGTWIYRRYSSLYDRPPFCVVQGVDQEWGSVRRCITIPFIRKADVVSLVDPVIAIAEKRVVQIWDVPMMQRTFEVLDTGVKSGDVLCLAMSFDLHFLACGFENQTIGIWDLRNKERVFELVGHEKAPHCLAASGRRHLLASASHDMTVRVWDMNTGQLILGPLLHGRPISCVAVPVGFDACFVASGSDDGAIRIWHSVTGKPVGEPLRGHDGPITWIAFSEDGKLIASASRDQTVKVWDVTSGTVTSQFADDVSYVSLRFSPDGQFLACGGEYGEVSLRSLETGVELCPDQPFTRFPVKMSFSQNSQFIAALALSCVCRVWEVADLLKRNEKGKSADASRKVTSLAISYDGQRIASAADDAAIKLWDGTKGALVCSWQHPPKFGAHVNCLAIYLDDRLAIGSSSSLTLWNPDGELVRVLQEGIPISTVTFSDDGGLVASHSVYDGVWIVWDVNNGEQVFAPDMQYIPLVCHLSFSTDNRCLRAEMSDGAQCCWRIDGSKVQEEESHEFRPSYRYDKETGWVQSEDGRRICWVPAEQGDVDAFAAGANACAIGGTDDDRITIVRFA